MNTFQHDILDRFLSRTIPRRKYEVIPAHSYFRVKFHFYSSAPAKEGGAITMSDKRRAETRKAITYGIFVIILYILLLTHQDFISAHFARGGWYALLPIITAFIFSFAHGKFTGSFWSALGIEASKKIRHIKKEH